MYLLHYVFVYFCRNVTVSVRCGTKLTTIFDWLSVVEIVDTYRDCLQTAMQLLFSAHRYPISRDLNWPNNWRLKFRLETTQSDWVLFDDGRDLDHCNVTLLFVDRTVQLEWTRILLSQWSQGVMFKQVCQKNASRLYVTAPILTTVVSHFQCDEG